MLPTHVVKSTSSPDAPMQITPSAVDVESGGRPNRSVGVAGLVVEERGNPNGHILGALEQSAIEAASSIKERSITDGGVEKSCCIGQSLKSNSRAAAERSQVDV